jgi:hypothetical protein
MIDQPPLLTFDLVYRTNGNTTIILSWHHLLMDGHGAILLLKQIAPDLTTTSPYIYDSGKPRLLGIKSFWQAARAKFFVDRISRKPLSGFMDIKRTATRKQKIHIINFTSAETEHVDQIAPRLGARFGRSPFYLACTTRTVYALLKKKGITVRDFWVPVPRNQRKKGAKGPVLGNHLAFLFYRIRAVDMASLADTVKSINHQTVEQIRSGMDKAYDVLTRYLRRTPLPLYYFWIKGPKGAALASFLFTVAADHPDDLATFDGHPIVDALSLPSNISPPGLTFAFMHFRGSLRLMVLYFEGLLAEHELEELEKQIRHELTQGTAYRDGAT